MLDANDVCDWNACKMKIKFFAVFATALLFGLQTRGATFSVNNTLDSTNSTSLRGAIIRANQLGGNNTIILTSDHYYLSNYHLSDLDITRGSLTIKSKSSALVTIDAMELGNRVFQIFPNTRAMFQNLIIIGGGSIFGGGINNGGILTLNNCVIEDNRVDKNLILFSNAGGGVYNTGSLLMNNCIVRNNSTDAGFDGSFFSGGLFDVDSIPGFSGTSGGAGAGIYNIGNLTMNNCIVCNNACGSGGNGTDSINNPAGNGGNGGNGGGIFNTGKLVMFRSVVMDNATGAGANGGKSFYSAGLPQDGSGGNGGDGGGIFNASDASPAKLIQTFVFSNTTGIGGDPGPDGTPGVDGSGPDFFGNFTISP